MTWEPGRWYHWDNCLLLFSNAAIAKYYSFSDQLRCFIFLGFEKLIPTKEQHKRIFFRLEFATPTTPPHPLTLISVPASQAIPLKIFHFSPFLKILNASAHLQQQWPLQRSLATKTLVDITSKDLMSIYIRRWTLKPNSQINFDFIYNNIYELFCSPIFSPWNLAFSKFQGQFWPRADMAALGQSEKIILEKVLQVGMDNSHFENQI